MTREAAYVQSVSPDHIRRFGQYFTPRPVADFLTRWACHYTENAHHKGTCPHVETLLDPAAGNSVFLSAAAAICPGIHLTGYELDPAVLDWFGNPARARMIRGDYLLADWDMRYDAVVCNPPYHRFQAVPNREAILGAVEAHTGVRYSGYTNLYLLFLLKSIHQLKPGGRLAYLVPSEFLDARSGEAVKRLLLTDGLLRAVVDFPQSGDLFPSAVTTICALLLERAGDDTAGHDTPGTDTAGMDTPGTDTPGDGTVDFYSVSSLECVSGFPPASPVLRVPCGELDPAEKWGRYLRMARKESDRAADTDTAGMDSMTGANRATGPDRANASAPVLLTRSRALRRVSDFCRVSRGIATGDNGFFCLSRITAERYGIPADLLSPCVCRSADVKGNLFTEADFRDLASSGKNAFLLNASVADADRIAAYLRMGEAAGVPEKYLPARRSPWYAMERREIAPIWVSSAYRGRIRFVRNLAGVRNLTTFHGVYVREPYRAETDLIFCYFLTPVAQSLLRENRKVLGGGLEKFQPGDLNDAPMVDLDAVTEEERRRILSLWEILRREPPSPAASGETEGCIGETEGCVRKLNAIFARCFPGNQS